MTIELKLILNAISPFTEEEFAFIEPYFQMVSLKKNEILLEEGQLCNTFFIVESGMLRNYYNNNGLDVNFSFTMEKHFTTNFEAYVNREPSKIIIQAMERSVVWVVNSRMYAKENGSFAAFSTFIRRVAIRTLMATEEHHNMLRMHAPADRYQYILEKKPELIQRIPLSYLASYLGITRETLSRIRSNKY
ncbi:Crp/Fnr family transcriptional regulator [Arachidicoccus sp.]|jgi:CRP-like cAMP-binding protein|uniref:Crp/Fnr family transcriptional regulator n=1 Tax=Arachidicoccus sp. TaxID=1872624 RepID=UPI003D1C1ED8